MGLSGSVENPVSLGCLQANDWGFLCPGISPHPVTQNRLDFLIVVGFLGFLSALVAMLGPGLGKIVPSLTLRGQDVLGGHIFQGVKDDLSKH